MPAIDATAIIAMRPATEDDVPAVARLAALDSAPCPDGELLLAVVDGKPLAALSVTTGQVVADPFFPTVELVELLRRRAARLRGTQASPGARRGPALVVRRRRRHSVA